mmetsp:Transcript_5762/g.12791  ORF Transcript_5762/g.12791 Transcript_5762/m.12791 type:complete len:210 (-) Transcript_5762:404-1033(-)
MGYTKNIVVQSKPLAMFAACLISPPSDKKLLSISPSVFSRNAKYPAMPMEASNITHSDSAVEVARAHRFFVGFSSDPATMKALCWQTNANDNTPSPMKIVDDFIIDLDAICFKPPCSSMEEETGLKSTTTKTIRHWKMTLTCDVFAKSAMSLCILIGSITAIVLTVKIDLSIPTSPFSTPNNIGSVSLIIVRYDRQPPYAMMSMLMEMK